MDFSYRNQVNQSKELNKMARSKTTAVRRLPKLSELKPPKKPTSAETIARLTKELEEMTKMYEESKDHVEALEEELRDTRQAIDDEFERAVSERVEGILTGRNETERGE